jgi:hypothetical protein
VELSVPGPHPVVIVGGGLGDVLHVELSVPGPHPVVIVGLLAAGGGLLAAGGGF